MYACIRNVRVFVYARNACMRASIHPSTQYPYIHTSIKVVLERVGNPALAAAFEEEILRCDLGLAGHTDAKISQNPKLASRKGVGSARVCALPSLAQIKGGKGHLFGWKYRRLQPGEVTSHESLVTRY